MLYVLVSIVFLYHQWLRWSDEMLERFVRQGGVHTIFYLTTIATLILASDQFWETNCQINVASDM